MKTAEQMIQEEIQKNFDTVKILTALKINVTDFNDFKAHRQNNILQGAIEACYARINSLQMALEN